MNNKELYKETFSCVQSTRKINLEENMKENKTFKFTKMYKYATAFAVTFCVVAGITISNNHKSQIKTIVTNEKENITHENINTVQNDVTNFTEEKIETDNEIIIENYTDNSKGPMN